MVRLRRAPSARRLWRGLGLPGHEHSPRALLDAIAPSLAPRDAPERTASLSRASVTAAITDLDPSSAAPTRSTATTKPNAAAVRAATSAWLCRVCIIVLAPSYRGWHVGPGVDEPILQRGCVGKGFGSGNSLLEIRITPATAGSNAPNWFRWFFGNGRGWQASASPGTRIAKGRKPGGRRLARRHTHTISGRSPPEDPAEQAPLIARDRDW